MNWRLIGHASLALSIACCFLAAASGAAGAEGLQGGPADRAAGLVLGRQISIHPAPRALAAGDFNRDGRKDLAIVRSASGRVSILLGNGDGDFGTRRAFAVPRPSNSVAVADVNRDGKQDLVVGADASYGRQGSVSVLLGRGDGRFAPARTYSTGSGAGVRSARSVAVSDVNGDGRPDVVTANGHRLIVLLGVGGGRLGRAHGYSADAAGSIASFAVGRLDKDRAPDAVTGSQEGVNTPFGVVNLLRGNGHGGFRRVGTDRTRFLIPDRLLLADVNNDGRRDLVVANYAAVSDWGEGGQDYAAIVISVNRGDGTFAKAAEYSVGTMGPSAFKAADFNGDGNPDLFLASAMSLYVLLGNGDGTFRPAVQVDATRRVGGAIVAVADFNGDDRPDAAVAAANGRTLDVFLNSGVWSR